MKKYLLFCLCVCLSVSARADYLDDKIATLTQQKLDLIAELEKCQKASGNLKIAGITTLGVSAIGIGANIAEAVALDKTQTKIDKANENLDDLNKEIQDIKAKKAAEDAIKPVVPSDSTPKESNTEIANCSPFTDCNSDANLQQLNAKTTQCAWGEYVATACADNTTSEQKQCKKSDGTTFTYYICTASQPEKTEPVLAKPRSYHSDCTDEETAKIPNAATSWWYKDKCVAKSCKPGTYLHIKNGESQGQCKTACDAWQIKEWKYGGQACDVAKTKPAEQQRCTRVYQVAINESVCKTLCAKDATDNKCLWNQDYLWKSNICICTPDQSDRNTVLNIGNVTSSVPVQKNDTTTVAKPKSVEPIAASAKPSENKPDCPEYYIGGHYTAQQCADVCKKYAQRENCKLNLSGTAVTATCYCNPFDSNRVMINSKIEHK